VGDYRDSADWFFIGDDDRDLDRDGGHTRECIHARRDETRDGQHVLVAIVIVETRDVRIDGSSGGRTVTRQMRVHLPRVVVRSVVVVEMHVRHRSGHGAHVDGNGEEARKTPTQHTSILDDAPRRVKERMRNLTKF